MGRHEATSSLSVTFAGHATVLLEMDGVRLLTDPLLRRRIGVLIRRSPVPPPAVRRDLEPCSSRTRTSTTWTCRHCG